MNFQKAKGIIILIIAISAIAGITYFLTTAYYLPKLEEKITKKQDEVLARKPVIVAARDIPIGTVIQEADLKTDMIPGPNIIDQSKVYTSSGSLTGQVAASTIYKGEQILKDKIITENMSYFESDKDKTAKTRERIKLVPTRREVTLSSKYITLDIPKYNFVNDRVDVGSIVDILVDKGQGKYAVVLAKITILDKVPIGATQQQNAGGQIARPLPKPLLISQNAQQKAPYTQEQLLIPNNPALESSEDYRITVIASEKEQKRVLEAMTYGKLMLRKYVFASQPASLVTFSSNEEKTVAGEGTEKLPELPPEDLPENAQGNALNNVLNNQNLPLPEQQLRQ